ncbi:MAG TPA: M20/M25/M40 family metallo-hydrolase [Candidatus Limnocylindrales bacterium]
MTPADDTVRAIGAAVDALRDELVAMTSELVDIPSPTGEEAAIGDYAAERFAGLGLDVERQELEAGRSNVVATWRGTGSGPSLLFNGHFDTGLSGREPNLPFGLRAATRIVDGWIYGLGVSNMKSAHTCYWGAIRALQEVGIRPAGDIFYAGVVGETEKSPTPGYEGAGFRAGGWGTFYASLHGVLADAAICGEPTGLRVQTGNSSYAFARVRTRGRSQHTWSKERGDDAIEKAVAILAELRAWEPAFEAAHPHPRMGSRIGFGAIQGGRPFQPCVNPAASCEIFLDLRFPPDASMTEVRRQLRDFLDDVRAKDPALESELSFFLCRNGYEIDDDEAVVRAVDDAHLAIVGATAGRPERYRYDVSADTSILHEFGVPGLTYGPGGIRRDGGYSVYDDNGELVSIENLVACTKVYALAALALTAEQPDPAPA